MEKEERALLDKTFQTFITVGFGGLNLDLLNGIEAMDVVGVGTAIDKKLFGIKDLMDLLIRQNEQSEGMEVSWKFKPLMDGYLLETKDLASHPLSKTKSSNLFSLLKKEPREQA